MKVFIAILISSLAIIVNSLSPIACGDNESYKECGSLCNAPFCESLYSEVIINCPDVCDEGCFCNEGFARNADNVCVDVAECAPKIECGSNEVLSKCASRCGEPSCINPTNAGVICAAVCNTGCVCKPDFIRDIKGVCIPISDCPKEKCQTNEIFSTCGNSCTEPSCDQRFTYHPCPDCQIGCFCKKGYARDNNNECIRASKCPRNQCNHKSEEYVCGVEQCENFCGKEVDEICKISNFVCEMGCFCKDGFIRGSSNGKCISQKECASRD